MGKIIRNGIPYSGSSNSARSINYDNTNSGLEAQTAQAAVDELNKKIQDIDVSGASNIKYLTKAEYDALPDSKLTNGVEYRITDANTDSTKARNIAYDGSASGLEAISVQDAIDAVNNRLSANNSDGSFVDISSYTSESNRYTFLSDGYLRLTFEGRYGTYCRIYVYSENNNEIALLCSAGVTDDHNAISSDIKSLFVKKGMSAYCLKSGNGSDSFRFYPIS